MLHAFNPRACEAEEGMRDAAYVLCSSFLPGQVLCLERKQIQMQDVKGKVK